VNSTKVKTVKLKQGIHCDGCKTILRIGHQYESHVGGMLYCAECAAKKITASAGSLE
jgi:hypothetical protein